MAYLLVALSAIGEPSWTLGFPTPPKAAQDKSVHPPLLQLAARYPLIPKSSILHTSFLRPPKVTNFRRLGPKSRHYRYHRHLHTRDNHAGANPNGFPIFRHSTLAMTSSMFAAIPHEIPTLANTDVDSGNFHNDTSENGGKVMV